MVEGREESSHVRRKSDRLQAVPVGITNIRRRYAPATVRDGCHGDAANVATEVRSSPTFFKSVRDDGDSQRSIEGHP